MKLMFKLAAQAFLASALMMAPATTTPAAAAPIGIGSVGSANVLGQTLDPLVEVQHRRDGRRHHKSRRHHQSRRHHHSRRHYAPRRGYYRGPPGYRRYGSRPSNWQRRGCVSAGPVWFCP